MSSLEILASIGLLGVLAAVIHILVAKPVIGSATLAAALSLGFGAYSLLTIAREGVALVWENHTTNLWGVQVWWDLLFAVGIALFFTAPRARKVGMSMLPWTLFVAATASIGLLAMIARLFWLEGRSETAS